MTVIIYPCILAIDLVVYVISLLTLYFIYIKSSVKCLSTSSFFFSLILVSIFFLNHFYASNLNLYSYSMYHYQIFFPISMSLIVVPLHNISLMHTLLCISFSPFCCRFSKASNSYHNVLHNSLSPL